MIIASVLALFLVLSVTMIAEALTSERDDE